MQLKDQPSQKIGLIGILYTIPFCSPKKLNIHPRTVGFSGTFKSDRAHAVVMLVDASSEQVWPTSC